DRGEAQRPRPVPHIRGLHRAGRAAQHGRPRAARRRPRLPPLLGRRASRRDVAGRAQPRGPHRADRLGDRAHPRRQRRRDAPALQPVQGLRVVQPARGPLRGADRPRHRPGPGHRPADDVRAPARSPRGGAGRLPPAACGAARAPRRDAARRPPVHPPAPGASRPPVRARGLAARVLAAERGVGGAARAPLRVRRLHRAGQRVDRAVLPLVVQRVRAPRAAEGGGRRVGDLRGDRRGGAGARGLVADDDDAAAPRPARPGAAGRQGAAVPRGREHRARRHGRPPRDPRLPCVGAREARGARRGLRRGGGRRRDDHLRPRRTPALLRAAGRGVRPEAASSPATSRGRLL
ncbi:MAG: Luciferase-like, partial [uncultured Solirubrobacteraceae bacterium]